MSDNIKFPHELFALCLFDSENSIKVTRHDTSAEWLDQMYERVWFLRCQKECPHLFPHLIPGTPYEKIHSFLVKSRSLLMQGRARLTRTVGCLFVAFRMARPANIHLSLGMGYINDPVPGRLALYLFTGTGSSFHESYQTMIEEIEGYYVPNQETLFSHIGAPRVVAQVLGQGEETMVHDPESDTNSKSRIYRDLSIDDIINVLYLATRCGFYPLPLTAVVNRQRFVPGV